MYVVITGFKDEDYDSVVGPFKSESEALEWITKAQEKFRDTYRFHITQLDDPSL